MPYYLGRKSSSATFLFLWFGGVCSRVRLQYQVLAWTSYVWPPWIYCKRILWYQERQGLSVVYVGSLRVSSPNSYDFNSFSSPPDPSQAVGSLSLVTKICDIRSHFHSPGESKTSPFMTFPPEDVSISVYRLPPVAARFGPERNLPLLLP